MLPLRHQSAMHLHWAILLTLLDQHSTAQARTASAIGDGRIFDYVVVGGGTCGLVVANRLSADPHITVAVIEAGNSQLNNASVSQVENYFTSLDTDIDWQYQSTSQQFTNNRTLTFQAGKALGGTSNINGATYVRAQKAQIDAWEQLGNSGWKWDALWPYYLKSENFTEPSLQQLESTGFTYNSDNHGYHGPLHTGITNLTMENQAHVILNMTAQAQQIPFNQDLNGGDIRGFSLFPSTVDATLNIRSDAARSYYQTIMHRPNLFVFENTVAHKLLWREDCSDSRSAAGVLVRHQNQTALTTIQAREVILSAGSLKSPIILENSGVGNPRILKLLDIPVEVDLPAVGENLQDQPNTIMNAEFTGNFSGYTPFVMYLNALDLFGQDFDAVSQKIAADISTYATAISEGSHGTIQATIVERQLRIQADLIFNRSVPVTEILWVPAQPVILAAFWGLLPFSRGSVHLAGTVAKSTPDLDPVPVINPNFFMLEWDAILQAATAEKVRSLLHQVPLSGMVGAENAPNVTKVPLGADVDTWLSWFKEIYTPNNHPIGTCAMMSRELGGVVDPNLIVYGTKNVRVIDASVLPFQIDGHLTSTLYALAERASDLILADRQ
ncbi:GMC oxidoreductase [Myriangium duriaei CBS 260.36]|uniref:GMC oxidoreductase n=1 Tax=Myriangium duriaei CBS 260.36 TaxID=1168546 RepID=A0A9P4J3B8_9PEZI|nr:GMC oxidoreductase [Myriangium duriaei CBS 260.36]